MPDITPRLGFSTPSEFEEPYFNSAKNFELGVDVGIYANAENSQLQFISDGIVGWNATMADPLTGVLFWSEDIDITAFSTPFKAVLPGPASVQLQDGEVLFFVMPRLMSQATPIQLYKSNRIFLAGTQIFDLRLFCARVGDTLHFYDNRSLKSGDTGFLWGGGLNNVSVFQAHNHLNPLLIEPGAPGIFTLDAMITSPSLLHVYVYRNGQLLTTPADYTLNPVTGIITLVVPTQNAFERFVILREQVDTTHVNSTHTHLTPLVIVPLPGTTVLDSLVTAPTLQGEDLFRNGFLQSVPDDYTLDPVTGFITLTTASVFGEVFQLLRRINI